jgi:hypothetical protein
LESPLGLNGPHTVIKERLKEEKEHWTHYHYHKKVKTTEQLDYLLILMSFPIKPTTEPYMERRGQMVKIV